MSSVTLKPIGYTYINSANPNTNYNGAANLYYGPKDAYDQTLQGRVYFDASKVKYKRITGFNVSGTKTTSQIRTNVFTSPEVVPAQFSLDETSVSDDSGYARFYAYIFGANGNIASSITYNNQNDGFVKGDSKYSLINKAVSNGGVFATDITPSGAFKYQYDYLGLAFLPYQLSEVEDGFWKYTKEISVGALTGSNVSLTVTYEDVVPETTFIGPVGEYNNINPITVSWDYSCDGGLTQNGFEIGWSVDNNTWTTISGEGNATSYELPTDTLPDGTVYIRIRTKNLDGIWSEYVSGSIYCTDNIPVVVPTYPVDINVDNTVATIFTWEYSEPIEVGQYMYEIGWSSDKGENWTYLQAVSSNHYHKFSANTFPTGTIMWKVKAINKYSKESQYAEASFNAIGKTEAPTITSVTANAIPTVSWDATYQDCYELRIREGGKIIYESGLMIGQDIRSHKCNIMLQNGVYTVEMRILNTYGYYTEWSSHSYVLELSAPEVANMIMAAVQDDYSVEVSGNTVNGLNTYVVRKDIVTEVEEIVGIYDGNFLDYKVPLNRLYQYTLRSYDATGSKGYADGEPQNIIVNTDGVIIHDIRDYMNFVNLHISEEVMFNVGRSDNYTKTLYQCIGRKYPVKEQMDWVVTTRQMTVWVSASDYIKLMDICENSGTVYYRADNEAFLCDIEMSLVGKYTGDGNIVTVTISRLDEDLEVDLT